MEITSDNINALKMLVLVKGEFCKNDIMYKVKLKNWPQGSSQQTPHFLISKS